MGDWPVTVNTLLFSWASCPAALIMELVVVVVVEGERDSPCVPVDWILE